MKVICGLGEVGDGVLQGFEEGKGVLTGDDKGCSLPAACQNRGFGDGKARLLSFRGLTDLEFVMAIFGIKRFSEDGGRRGWS